MNNKTLNQKILKIRKQAINNSDKKLLKHITHHTHTNKPKFLFILFIIVVLFGGFLYPLSFLRPPITQIINHYHPTETIYKPTPNNLTTNCVKIQQLVNGTPTNKFFMNCERFTP